MMSGWLLIDFSNTIFIKMFVIGLLSYIVVALIEYRKIIKVPMDEALKNVE